MLRKSFSNSLTAKRQQIMLTFVLQTLVAVSYADAFTKANAFTPFLRHSSLDDLKPDNTPDATKTTTRTQLECAVRCNQHRGCHSLFYVPLTGLCEHHGGRYNVNSTGLVAAPSAVYFERAESTKTSTRLSNSTPTPIGNITHAQTTATTHLTGTDTHKSPPTPEPKSSQSSTTTVPPTDKAKTSHASSQITTLGISTIPTSTQKSSSTTTSTPKAPIPSKSQTTPTPNPKSPSASPPKFLLSSPPIHVHVNTPTPNPTSTPTPNPKSTPASPPIFPPTSPPKLPPLPPPIHIYTPSPNPTSPPTPNPKSTPAYSPKFPPTSPLQYPPATRSASPPKYSPASATKSSTSPTTSSLHVTLSFTNPTTRNTSPDCSSRFICPGNEPTRMFISADLDDCTTVQYRIFNDKGRSYAEAKAKCEEKSSTLLKITTLAKMTYFTKIMSSDCSVYAQLQIWVNGRYNTRTSTWETEDGERLPMAKETFWFAGRPNYLYERDTCVWMAPSFNHLWDDCDCVKSYTTICEKYTP